MTTLKHSNSNCSIASELLAAIARSKSASEFREQALAAVGSQMGQGRVAWVHQQGEHWEVAGAANSLAQLPIELAASACDQMSVLSASGWLAVPITGRTQPSEVLLLSPASVIDANEAEGMAHPLRSGLMIAVDQSELQSRGPAIADAAAIGCRLQHSHDLTELLNHMALAAARVLHWMAPAFSYGTNQPANWLGIPP